QSTMYSEKSKVEKSFLSSLTVCLCRCSLQAPVSSNLPNTRLNSFAHHRHKREWQWNSIFVQEEQTPPFPHKIGKLKSTRFNKNAMFIIQGEGANTIFKVDAQGDLFVNQPLDREEKEIYKLQAEIRENLTGVVLEEADHFYIKVLDINDNAPKFEQSQYKGSVKEGSPEAGTSVLTVKALDPDDATTENGKVVYELIEGTDAFYIDRTTGTIKTKVSSLDREKKSSYKLTVRAKDMPNFSTGGSTTTTVAITLEDENDNKATFKYPQYEFEIKENEPARFTVGKMQIEDKDEPQNKNPVFNIEDSECRKIFDIKTDLQKDGAIFLLQPLDYENKQRYTFEVAVSEETVPSAQVRSHKNDKARVTVNVLDVDEPPVFTNETYRFHVKENVPVNTIIGRVSAWDPDKANKTIRYEINKGFPVRINEETGELLTAKELDRELNALHQLIVTAVEYYPEGLKSHVTVTLNVLDVNDNPPELDMPHNPIVCENDGPGMLIQRIRATDKDEQTPDAKISFSLAEPSANFSLTDNHDGTANITVKQGGFTDKETEKYVLSVVVRDNGIPPQSSTTTLTITVCKCDVNRENHHCRSHYKGAGVSVPAIIVILLCIITIIVIVLLFVLRKRYRKDALVNLSKGSGEIHEQLVSYDEEGGGEMDTNGYDVSVLNSARHNNVRPEPSLYAKVQKPTGKADMAIMIEVKKDEADHDKDGIPYDTLHIYGYEGPESLAGSLSSLETSSSDSNLDYDFLNDWGPRFKTLAELYGVDGSEDDFEC
uniref:Cadherin-5 n=1 Tax=Lepisosteus oculatus TaxID=7918 RepID=W5MD19_LEPOC